MTAKELIEELEKMPEDKEVIFSYGNDEYEFYVEVDEVTERTIRINNKDKAVVFLDGWEY